MGNAMPLPHPHELAALGAVLCLYRIQAGSELDGWSQAARVSSDSALDSDGLCESLQFFDRDGLCCWRLYLLPDTDFLRIVRREGIDDAGLIDDCCCRQAATNATMAPMRGDIAGHPDGFNTSTWA